LISDDGKLIGVNAFKASGGEGLNFAVAVNEVEKFLAAAAGWWPTAEAGKCRAQPCQGKGHV